MKNNLYVTTPYNTMKTINSNFELEIKANKKYVISLGIDYHNNTEVVKVIPNIVKLRHDNKQTFSDPR